MLNEFAPKISEDFDIPLAANEAGVYSLPLAEEGEMVLQEKEGTVSLFCSLGQLPKERTEELIEKMLGSNLFGRETFLSVLGLKPDGKTVILQRDINYPIGYDDFKLVFEDFINSIATWGSIINSR